jgi:hypothetical protein
MPSEKTAYGGTAFAFTKSGDFQKIFQTFVKTDEIQKIKFNENGCRRPSIVFSLKRSATAFKRSKKTSAGVSPKTAANSFRKLKRLTPRIH